METILISFFATLIFNFLFSYIMFQWFKKWIEQYIIGLSKAFQKGFETELQNQENLVAGQEPKKFH